MVIKKIMAFALAVILVCSVLLTGCGGNNAGFFNNVSEKDIVKNGIQMDNYLTFYTKGCDGYGRVYVDIDLFRLKNDCSKFLKDDASIPESLLHDMNTDTASGCLDYIFSRVEEYRLLDCDTPDGLKNGDIVNISVDVPDSLSKILTVEIKATTVAYELSGLEAVESIDPFELVRYGYRELVSVDNTIGYKLKPYADALILLPTGDYTYIAVDLNIDKDNTYKRTDTIHVSLSEDIIDSYVEKYGENIFSRTEADITLDRLGYLPTGDNARDVFECMDEVCLDNIDYTTKQMMDYTTRSETTVERLGMMFFYDEDGVLETRNDPYKFYNQIVFIYKITNEICPEGWYTYMALNGYVSVGYNLNKATLALEEAIGDCFGSHIIDDYTYYQNENPKIYCGTFPMTFECDGKDYIGHCDLKDVFTAIQANMEGANDYDHLIVTDSLADYVSEY